MQSKAEQNKLCVVVIEQTLPYLGPVVICRKSLTAALEQINHTASPDPTVQSYIPTVSPGCYFAVFKTMNSHQPLQNLQCWTYTRKYKECWWCFSKKEFNQKSPRLLLKLIKGSWHPKRQLLTQTKKRQTWSRIVAYQEECFLAFHV